MAHVILFTDRAPRSWSFDQYRYDTQYLTHSAGAFKLASHLRQHGFQVLVVPNCCRLSWAGMQQIINQNSRDLLWVGISTTFLSIKRSSLDSYREQWMHSTDAILSMDALTQQIHSWEVVTELVLGTKETNCMARWLKDRYDVPLLIGGAWVSTIKDGNLHNLDPNVYIVDSITAEKYVEEFSKSRLKDPQADPPFFVDNSHYDRVEFKTSTIDWLPQDQVEEGITLPIEVARGCAFNCAYCQVPRKDTVENYKDPEVLRQEMIRNYEMFGTTRYLIVDDLYNDSKKKVRELYDKVWSRLPFQPEWSSYMRLDMFWADPESIEIVKASGAKLGTFGIETLHDAAGKKVGKGLGKKRILETLQRLKESWGDDILVNGLFITGLPKEPRESLHETIQWLETTDLLSSYTIVPLWVTPPAHRHMTLINHDMDRDNEKYLIRWKDDNTWINDQGITFTEANQLAAECMKNRPRGMRVGFSDYADLRTLGLSHQDIVDYKNITSDFDSKMKRLIERNEQRILERLNRVLSIKDVI